MAQIGLSATIFIERDFHIGVPWISMKMSCHFVISSLVNVALTSCTAKAAYFWHHVEICSAWPSGNRLLHYLNIEAWMMALKWSDKPWHHKVSILISESVMTQFLNMSCYQYMSGEIWFIYLSWQMIQRYVFGSYHRTAMFETAAASWFHHDEARNGMEKNGNDKYCSNHNLW